MPNITYSRDLDVRVYLDKKFVGAIRRTSAGWVYYPKGSKTGSEPNHSLDEVKRSLEQPPHAEDYFDHVAALKRQGLKQDGTPC